ncbi:Vanadium chloroperoxidase [Rhodopirellula islandica]|uniref:Vanadium chloroperoxidase n=1 Tax=Rhodopirellula islandica TaxID=595434 RepID=A0A0J1BGV7_RHOIS|nr:dockerin type I domain-containing protein [Rhodopirellula islandica]KLU05761.1 Vanadium chloroperoxidase [Rhodopirellula islandica]
MPFRWNRWIGTSKSARIRKRRRQSTCRRLRSENLETRNLLAANLFHNEAMPEDVNEDDQVTAIDALTIINRMNREQSGEVAGDVGRGQMTDVNNDGRNSALDALMVVNRLNREQLEDRDSGSRDTGAETKDQTDAEDTTGGDSATDESTTDDQADSEIELTGDAVLDWNNLFNELTANSADNQNPGYASRAMAMLNVAIYDSVAIASGDSDLAFYEYDSSLTKSSSDVSSQAAASSAAHSVLSSLYPEQQESIDSFYADVLATYSQDSETEAGLVLGAEVGSTVIENRVDDGADAIVEYTYTDEAGAFQSDPLNPDVPVWGPGWGEVDPFAISDADAYTPESPPALTSEEYAASYNEVKELGAVDSVTRTADQTEAGIFWAYDREGLGTPLSLFNDILETVAVQEGNSLEENAALFAQASVAMADAAVVAWTTKFEEEFWRPVTAIQDGDADGNALTEGDPEWTALGAPDGGDDIVGFTPQFPTYISGHATFGGALFGTLQEFYGTDDISFTVASEELEILLDDPELQAAYGLDLDDAERTFDSFSEAMAENGRSRVYLGIHFDFDDLVGQEVGQMIAASVASEFTVATPDDDSTGKGVEVEQLATLDRENQPNRDDSGRTALGNPESTIAKTTQLPLEDGSSRDELNRRSEEDQRLAAVDHIFAENRLI